MQSLSLQLITAHPMLYTAHVAEGWVDFWKAPTLWQAGNLRAPVLTDAFFGLGTIQPGGHLSRQRRIPADIGRSSRQPEGA